MFLNCFPTTPTGVTTGSLSNILYHCNKDNVLPEQVTRTGSLPSSGSMGSMPNIRLADILKKQTAFYLVTIKIDDDPLKLIKEPNPDLQLNGFSVTLAELTTMYQVGGKRGKAMVQKQ